MLRPAQERGWDQGSTGWDFQWSALSPTVYPTYSFHQEGQLVMKKARNRAQGNEFLGIRYNRLEVLFRLRLAESERGESGCLSISDMEAWVPPPPQQPCSPRRPRAAICVLGSRGWCCGQKATAGSSGSAQAPGGCVRRCGWAWGPQGPSHPLLLSPWSWTSAWRKSWQVFTDSTGVRDWRRPLVPEQPSWAPLQG